MPKETFLNLPPPKREAVLSQAFIEFATHDYTSASLSRIVRKAGIAKGSMYQYFENKRDLYFYLIDSAFKRKLEFIASESAVGGETFFETFKSIIKASVRFDFVHPEISGLIMHARSEPPGEELENVADEFIGRSNVFFEGFVRSAVERGEIEGDISMIVHILDQTALTFSLYLQRNHRDEISRNGEIIEEKAEDLAGLLKNGLSKKTDSFYTCKSVKKT
ncbi:MAG: TetR/AcrR family transcriptional regulator [Spirochaetia bacterium]